MHATRLESHKWESMPHFTYQVEAWILNQPAKHLVGRDAYQLAVELF